MKNFASKDDAFSYKEKGLQVIDLAYMEMPKEREKYNLSKISGSIGLIAGRFKTKEDADAEIEEFLTMTLK